MQRSTVLFGLLGCAAVAVVCVMAFSGPGEVVQPPDNGHTDPGGTNHQNGSSGSSPIPAQVTGFDGPVPPDAPHVSITVTSRERFVAPPQPPRLAVTVDGEALPVEVLAGVGSGFDARPGGRGVAMIAVTVAPGRLLRQVARGPGRPPTRIGPRIVVRGSVTDAAKKPIQAANVWFGELLGDGSRREFVVDEEGNFEADVPAGNGVPMLVRAEGYASQWRSIVVGTDTGALAEVLQPATKVQVQLSGMAVAMDGARAFVVTRSKVSSGVSQWPFFAQCVSGGYPISEEGRFEISDLPQVGEVGIIVRHPMAPLRAPHEVKLSDKIVRTTMHLGISGGVLQGIVVNEDQEPVAASLWTLRPRQRLDTSRSQRLLPPHLTDIGACYAESGEGGTYEIGGVVEQIGTLTIRGHGHAGRTVPVEMLMNAEVVLPKWRGGDAALRILPPIAGKVWRVSINLGGGIDEACAADEPFTVALPHAGIFDVAMQLQIDGELRGERDVKPLLVTGPVDLATPAPQ